MTVSLSLAQNKLDSWTGNINAIEQCISDASLIKKLLLRDLWNTQGIVIYLVNDVKL